MLGVKMENCFRPPRTRRQVSASAEDKTKALNDDYDVAGVTWDSIPLKLAGGPLNRSPGPKIPVERIRGTKQIDPPLCKQISEGSKFTSIKYYYNNII